MSKLAKNIIIFVLVVIIMSAGFYFLSAPSNAPKSVGVLAFINAVNSGQVSKVDVSGNNVIVTLNDDKSSKIEFQKESQDSVASLLSDYKVAPDQIEKIKGDINTTDDAGWAAMLSSTLPFILMAVILGAVVIYFLRQVQGANNRAMSFGQSGARQVDVAKKDRITFANVAGATEAKEELMEVVEFLKHPKKFLALGAKIPKGVLLMGSPGTGKTLLAKAVAGEANVPFFSISGSEFVEMFVGVGASRVRDLFKKAKKSAPCIVFIDEIDAVGRQRGSGMGGSHDEREQTLNQILVEMDGFDTDTNVIVVAATNRPDVLDPALLRPGRFDRQVVLDKPDVKERLAILEVHRKNKPLDETTDLEEVAKRTPGFSGADLANILNEAAILTARRNKQKISQAELLESIEKVSIGPERKSHLLSDKEKKITAYHEAGHALVASNLEGADPVHKVSIISRGRAAGYTMTIPSEDKKMQRRSEFIAELGVMLGGHAAEKAIFGEVSTGAHNDLKRATNLARRMITDYGMSETMPPRTFGERGGEMIFLGRELHEQRDYSEKVAEKIDEEISSLIADAFKTSTGIIGKHKASLERIVKVLLEKETIEKDEFQALVKA